MLTIYNFQHARALANQLENDEQQCSTTHKFEEKKRNTPPTNCFVLCVFECTCFKLCFAFLFYSMLSFDFTHHLPYVPLMVELRVAVRQKDVLICVAYVCEMSPEKSNNRHECVNTICCTGV